METLDLTKIHKELYTASAKKASFIETPTLNALVIDGVGSPDQEPFQKQRGGDSESGGGGEKDAPAGAVFPNTQHRIPF
jgi:hypothetical protein